MLVVAVVVAAAFLLVCRHRGRSLRRAWDNELTKQQTKDPARPWSQTDSTNESQSRFVAMVSHDLRSPLSSVLGYAELIEALPEDERVPKWAASIRVAGGRLASMIEDLLQVTASNAESVGIELYALPANLAHILDDVAAAVQRRTSDQSGIVRVEAGPGVDDLVLVDARRLRQVLVNLATNAIQYSDGDRVVIEAHRAPERGENYFRFAVTDEGPGIEPRDEEEIFEPFFRGSPEYPGGIGLGLAICAQIVGLMGSKMELDNHYGEACTFHFTVQLDAAPTGLDLVGAPHQGRTVLIIDDEESALDYLTEVLAGLDVDCHATASGLDALENLDEIGPFLILTDLAMPEISGLDLARRIRERNGYRSIPIIAITANVESAVGHDEFDLVLPKPVTPTQLRRAVGPFLGGQQASG